MLKSIMLKGTLIAAFWAVAHAAHAVADTPQRIDVPAGELVAALQSLATQADIEIIFQAEELKGLRTEGVTGSYAPAEALRALLKGTALRVYTDSSGAMLIESPAVPTSKMRPRRAPHARLAQAETPATGSSQDVEPSAARRNAGSEERASTAGSSNEDLQELVVTGTRLRRTGYDQPTPVTALNADALQAAAPSNIANALNQLPQFSRSTTGTSCCNPGTNGNFLNLRALGANRLLVLLDGDRLTPTKETGAIDADLLPELLVERVDVVTGGASAAYGSDAVSGVVNYIVDRKFDGFKALTQTGLSTYGDANEVKVGLAAGKSFADGRAHAVLSLEHYETDGIPSVADRPHGYDGHFLAGNGTAATPYQVVFGARNATATNGGVIVNSSNLPVANTGAPLAGILFEPGGATRNAVLGTAIPGSSGTYIGGDGYVYGAVTALAPRRTDKLYGRFSYDLSDTLRTYVRVNAARTHSSQNAVENGQRNTTSFTIFRDNAFLPASVASLMDANGVTSFRMGRQDNDFGLVANDFDTQTYDANLGLAGDLHNSWTWQANYSHGKTKLEGEYRNNAVLDNLYAAADAATDPATGQIVCRVTLTHPGVFPGCVPINLFGNGSPSQAAIDYVTADVPQTVTNTQQVAALNLQGTLFELPAGAMSTAIGVEYRRQSLDSDTSALTTDRLQALGVRGMPTALCSTVTTCRFGRLNQTTNFGEAHASSEVQEGFVETLVPLLHDLPLIKQLELNGAFRYTDYETSGGVNTWKVGLSYQPFAELRFRATRSRDIRAPNLFEQFSDPVVGQAPSITDPAANNRLYAFVPTLSQGNPDLKPEEADTKALGVIYQPSWLAGFSASVDYYDIDISDALATTAAQTTLIDCQAGDAQACSRISRDPSTGDLQQILLLQINLDSRRTSGMDIDLSYRHPLGAGTLGVRGVFNRLFDFTDTVGGLSTQFAGFQGTPHWRGNLALTYDLGGLSLFVQERYIGEVQRYVGSPGRNQIRPVNFGSVFYTDVTGSWKFRDDKLEVYGTVNNVFNRKPPLNAQNSNPGFAFPTDFNSGYYDIMGTYFTIGARARF